jgi:hypothetical protein
LHVAPPIQSHIYIWVQKLSIQGDFWVSYFRPWFLWHDTKKLVIPFLLIYLFASLFICALCIPTPEISQTSPDIHPLNRKSSFMFTSLTTTYLWVRIVNSRKIARWCQDWRFHVSLQRKNISSTYLISITSLPEDKQTSKHGGGGRYNAILEFKGEKIKKWWERKRKKWL